LRLGSTLVTLDQQQLQRVTGIVAACMPTDLSEDEWVRSD